jgi:hypothetical protein
MGYSMARWLCAVSVLLFAFSAHADDEKDKAFKFAKRRAVKQAVWKANLGLSLVMTSGNSNTTILTGSGSGTWRDQANRIGLDAYGSTARTQQLIATDLNGDNKFEPNEVSHVSKETTRNWGGKLRYDRFFGETNSGYVAGAVSADPIAGKRLVLQAQGGLSHTLVNNDDHELVVEIGYDFSSEAYVDPTIEANSIHSLRLYGGYKLKLAEEIFVGLGVEALENLNQEQTPTGVAKAFEDTRINSKLMFEARIMKHLTARFSFTARYDNVPAPRPDFDPPLPLTFILPAEKLDTLTELTLLVKFE